jgi:Fungal chitosanase of glycosyl hydrolase group 75
MNSQNGRFLMSWVLVLISGLLVIVLANGSSDVTNSSNSTALQLLQKLKTCQQVSKGLYATDTETKASIAVCDTKNAVWWNADMDIDCDGINTIECNPKTDTAYQPETSLETSSGQPFNAATMPYVVIPSISSRWNYQKSGIALGAVVAVIYKGAVEYGVFADTGPVEIIGEASYALAKRLGIDPDPTSGGVDSGVTYLVFKNSRVSPVESQAATVSLGQKLVKDFLKSK